MIQDMLIIFCKPEPVHGRINFTFTEMGDFKVIKMFHNASLLVVIFYSINY
jgi:hypothetical protein